MAQQTWDANRTGGGTYEFSRDAQGNYVLNSVGFKKFGKLNLPDLGKSTQTTQTTKDTPKDTAALSAQTKQAFGDVQPFYYDKEEGGKINQYTMKKEGDLSTDIKPMVSSDRQPGFEVSNTRTSSLIKKDTIPTWAKDVNKRGYENITFGGADEIPADKQQTGRSNIDEVLAEREKKAQINKYPGMVGPQKPSPYQDAIMRGERGG